MLTYTLFAIAAIFLTGTAVLIHGLVTSVEGYQDALGFHQGTEPQNNAQATSHRKHGRTKSRSVGKRRAAKHRALEYAL
jgi:hypothetical protein